MQPSPTRLSRHWRKARWRLGTPEELVANLGRGRSLETYMGHGNGTRSAGAIIVIRVSKRVFDLLCSFTPTISGHLPLIPPRSVDSWKILVWSRGLTNTAGFGEHNNTLGKESIAIHLVLVVCDDGVDLMGEPWLAGRLLTWVSCHAPCEYESLKFGSQQHISEGVCCCISKLQHSSPLILEHASFTQQGKFSLDT